MMGKAIIGIVDSFIGILMFIVCANAIEHGHITVSGFLFGVGMFSLIVGGVFLNSALRND